MWPFELFSPLKILFTQDNSNRNSHMTSNAPPGCRVRHLTVICGRGSLRESEIKTLLIIARQAYVKSSWVLLCCLLLPAAGIINNVQLKFHSLSPKLCFDIMLCAATTGSKHKVFFLKTLHETFLFNFLPGHKTLHASRPYSRFKLL